MNEPNINPLVDKISEAIHEQISNLQVKDLAWEVLSLDLDEKAKEIILVNELPQNVSMFIIEVIYHSNIDFLLKLVSKETLDEIRELIIDKKIYREEE